MMGTVNRHLDLTDRVSAEPTSAGTPASAPRTTSCTTTSCTASSCTGDAAELHGVDEFVGTTMSTAKLDTAITAVKASAAELATTPDVEPADLSAVIAGLRELAWTLDHHVTTVARRYDDERLGALRHDHGDDPHAAVEMIRLRLGDVTTRLADIDEGFGDAHDHAARLARA